jgi:hypothetical protein
MWFRRKLGVDHIARLDNTPLQNDAHDAVFRRFPVGALRAIRYR